MLDENEFLSPHGLRALSAGHRDEPFSVDLAGMQYSVDYEPAESTTGLFGGNSNWRGPVWFPVNHLLVEAVDRFARFYGDDFTVECPTGSGRQLTLARSPTSSPAGWSPRSSTTPTVAARRSDRPRSSNATRRSHDRLLFNEYFHGDTGAGLGASHQTGWTGLVADLITRRRR